MDKPRQNQNQEGHTPDGEARKPSPVHEEDYADPTMFTLRQRRLEELGYTKALQVKVPVRANPLDYLTDTIHLIQQYNCDVVRLSCGRSFLLYQRSANSDLVSAREDYDAVAGEDNVISFAIAQIRGRSKKVTG